MRVLALDLAFVPAHLGIMLLDGTRLSVVVPPEGDPSLQTLRRKWREPDRLEERATRAAEVLADFAAQLRPDVIAIDGAQGLATPERPRRRAEAILRTSGATAGSFQPSKNGFTWPALVQLSVRLFDRLEVAGYRRDGSETMPKFGHGERWALEVFPNASWHAFGSEPKVLNDLRSTTLGQKLEWPRETLTDHQCDAAVAILTVLAAQEGSAVRVGSPATIEAGLAREGFIYIPDPGRRWRVERSLSAASQS